jgi:ATP-dependent DNA ligase
MHVIRPSVALLAEVPVRYVVSDILRRAGRLLREEPFTIRRQILDDLRLDTAGLQVSPMPPAPPASW